MLPASETLLQLAIFAVSFLTIRFLFAAICRFLPDVILQSSDVAVGACVTAVALASTLLRCTLGEQVLVQHGW